jgi:hypothetical protein
MPTPLPKQLAHLDPVITDLDKFDPDSLGDDNPDAINFVELAVRSRIRGMNESDARTTVEENCTALEQWLRQPDSASSPAHFIYGAMFGMMMYGDFGELAREAPDAEGQRTSATGRASCVLDARWCVARSGELGS